MFAPEVELAIKKLQARDNFELSDLQTIITGSEGFLDFDDILPFCFPLDGKPMDVKIRRPMFRPLFARKRKAKKMIFLSARQLGKSASTAAAMLMNLTLRKNFRVMYVSPMAIYTSRMHHGYMGAMQSGCMLPFPIQDTSTTNNVNEKTFTSGSHYFGTSMFTNANNLLGTSIDSLYVDETQGVNIEFLPYALETLGTSDYRWETYMGTARGMENTIQTLFNQSSQNEWHMRCKHCGYINIPIGDDAFKMIQPSAVCCARCSRTDRPRPLNVNDGWWKPLFPDRENVFAGYHIPQTIVADRISPDRYVDTIYNKLHGISRYSTAKFQQEVLGISSEQGGVPITPQQIKDACILPKEFDPHMYSHIAGGADWGGSEITSFTVGTLVGYHAGSGKFHCLGAVRPTGVQDNFRHLPVAAYFKKYAGDRLVGIGADGGFVGSVQNPNLAVAAGVPCGSILYGSIKTFYRGTGGKFNLFTVDRSTIIYIVLSMIIEGKLLMPEGPEFEVFWSDLLAVVAEDLDTPSGTTRRYTRISSRADDFLHALGYGLFICALMSGQDLPSRIGLATNSSVNRATAELIGEEDPYKGERKPTLS